MVTPAVDGIDLFKIAGRSISGWIPSFKIDTGSPIRQPFGANSKNACFCGLNTVPMWSVMHVVRRETG